MNEDYCGSIIGPRDSWDKGSNSEKQNSQEGFPKFSPFYLTAFIKTYHVNLCIRSELVWPLICDTQNDQNLNLALLWSMHAGFAQSKWPPACFWCSWHRTNWLLSIIPPFSKYRGASRPYDSRCLPLSHIHFQLIILDVQVKYKFQGTKRCTCIFAAIYIYLDISMTTFTLYANIVNTF